MNFPLIKMSLIRNGVIHFSLTEKLKKYILTTKHYFFYQLVTKPVVLLSSMAMRNCYGYLFIYL